jgi:hypothetical protein
VLRAHRRGQRHALGRCELLELVARLAVVLDHLRPELLHLRVGGLLLREVAELDLGHAAHGGLFHEFAVDALSEPSLVFAAIAPALSAAAATSTPVLVNSEVRMTDLP